MVSWRDARILDQTSHLLPVFKTWVGCSVTEVKCGGRKDVQVAMLARGLVAVRDIVASAEASLCDRLKRHSGSSLVIVIRVYFDGMTGLSLASVHV